MIAKPTLIKAEQRANELYQFIKDGRVVTKSEICELYGWIHTSNNDRRVREIIALLATKKPIVSTSDSRGYKIAETSDEALHELNELKSRVAEIEKRYKPLEDYLIKKAIK